MRGRVAMLAVLASWCGAAGAGGTDIFRVNAVTEGLQSNFHAWVLLDVALYADQNGANFTCATAMTSTPLSWAGPSLTQSYGCWSAISNSFAMAGMMPCGMGMMAGMGVDQPGCEAAVPPGTTAGVHDSGFFLEMGRSYAVCGLSVWNDFFSHTGKVTLSEAGGNSLVSFQSSTVLDANTNGVAKQQCMETQVSMHPPLRYLALRYPTLRSLTLPYPTLP